MIKLAKGDINHVDGARVKSDHHGPSCDNDKEGRQLGSLCNKVNCSSHGSALGFQWSILLQSMRCSCPEIARAFNGYDRMKGKVENSRLPLHVQYLRSGAEMRPQCWGTIDGAQTKCTSGVIYRCEDFPSVWPASRCFRAFGVPGAPRRGTLGCPKAPVREHTGVALLEIFHGWN